MVVIMSTFRECPADKQLALTSQLAFYDASLFISIQASRTMRRSCILFVIAAMTFTCCNAIDQEMKARNSVHTDNVPTGTGIYDRNGYRSLRSYKTGELDDATDNEERVWDMSSLKSLVKIKKTTNDFSTRNLERMMIDAKFKKEMIEKWGKFYNQEVVISKLQKKDPAMLLDFLNGKTALRPLIKVERPPTVG